MEYTIQTAVTGEFDDVVDTTIAALKDEGFGVLCDIDIQATLKENSARSSASTAFSVHAIPAGIRGIDRGDRTRCTPPV